MGIKFPLAKPFFGGSELIYVKECLDSGWVAHNGPFSLKLLERIKNITGVEYPSLQSGCTASLHASLLATGISQKDDVLVSDFTYPAPAHAIKMCGANPIFIDTIEDTYNINPDLIEEAITKQTKAILAVHQFGAPCEINKILKIAQKYDLKLIEDCACALGTTINGKSVGSFGNVGCFSLHARKGITTGEGGITVTNDKSIHQLVNSYARFGLDEIEENGLQKCRFTKLGYNYKFSDISAAVGLAQIEKLSEYLDQRKLLANYYLNSLKDIEDILLPDNVPGHTWQSFVIRVSNEINRDKLMLKLLKSQVQTQIGTYACNLEPVYKSSQSCPVSENLFRKTLALPFYVQLNTSNIDEIVMRLKLALVESKC